MIANILTSANFWYITEAVVVVGGSCVGVWRIVHNALSRSVAENLKEMQAELRPNHGSSLRDAIDRIERNVDEVKIELARHLGAHKGL
jgi:hypothetical protein